MLFSTFLIMKNIVKAQFFKQVRGKNCSFRKYSNQFLFIVMEFEIDSLLGMAQKTFFSVYLHKGAKLLKYDVNVITRRFLFPVLKARFLCLSWIATGWNNNWRSTYSNTCRISSKNTCGYSHDSISHSYLLY